MNNAHTALTPVTPVYPDCVVQLTGVDGNAFNVLGTVKRSLTAYLSLYDYRSTDMRQAIVDAFVCEATAGDYNHLLRTCMAWVTIE